VGISGCVGEVHGLELDGLCIQHILALMYRIEMHGFFLPRDAMHIALCCHKASVSVCHDPVLCQNG